MPVHCLLGADSKGRPSVADHSYEVDGAAELCMRAYEALDPEDEHIFIVHAPAIPGIAADLVVVKERGIGIVDLKGYAGTLTGRANEPWFADSKRVGAGREHGRPRVNPHAQVQSYAARMRQLILDKSKSDASYFPPTRNGTVQINTGICFTHKRVAIDKLVHEYDEIGTVKPWEHFTIFTSPDFPRWLNSLSFRIQVRESTSTGGQRYQSVRLALPQMQSIARDICGAVPWAALGPYLTGSPYAYLTPSDAGLPRVALSQRIYRFGRSPELSDVVIPELYSGVSRAHAELERRLDAVIIKDQGSSHGTFVDGRRLEPLQPTALSDGCEISLGDPSSSRNARFQYHKAAHAPAQTTIVTGNDGDTQAHSTPLREVGRSAISTGLDHSRQSRTGQKDAEHGVNRLREFTMPTARPLPVIVLADTSGSMSEGGKIEALRAALKGMITSFAEQEVGRAEIHVGIVTFGGTAKIQQALAPSNTITLSHFDADGVTPLGEALDLARTMIEDRQQVPSRAYTPAVVLLSDGHPTDAWRPALERFFESNRANRAQRFALGIGADADVAVLRAFLANPEASVYGAGDARQIKSFFNWITMSMVTRSRSMNPDTAAFDELPPTDLDELL